MNRYLSYRILPLVVLMSTIWLQGCSAVGQSPTHADVEPTPLPTTAALAKPTYTAQRGEVVATVGLTGRISPVNQQPLFFPVDGRVRTVYVNVGDMVKTGTVIADLEGVVELQRQLDLSQISLKQSQLSADMAQQSYDLFVAQTPKRSASYQNQLAIEKDKLELAKLDVQKASLAIQELQGAVGQNQIAATIAGQVTAIQISTGDQIHAYDSIGIVADPNQLEVSASVTDFNLLNRVAVGMKAAMVSGSGMGKPVTGSIRLLPFKAANTQASDQGNIIHFSVDSPLAGAGYQLDDLVKITVILTKRENALWVPPQTIRTFSGRTFVVVQDGDVQRRVDVNVGVIGADRAEILSGLTEGQVVVSP